MNSKYNVKSKDYHIIVAVNGRVYLVNSNNINENTAKRLG